MRNITFINAGAGSGKTYRLTTDLTRKLTQEGIDPSQVILTTYTELAASEFREKARKEILNAKREDGAPVAASIRIKAATQLDNAFIGTVHAISFRFIRKYWYLLDYGADIQPMSDQNQDFYMSQSISDIVTEPDRKVFREFRAAFDIKDSKSRPDHLFWLPELKTIVDKMEYYDIKDVTKSIEKSYDTVEKIFTGQPVAEALVKINAHLPLLRERCEGLLCGRSAEKAQRYLKVILATEGRPLQVDDLNWKNGTSNESLIDPIGSKNDAFYSSEVYLDAKEAYNHIPVSRDYLPTIKSYLDTIFSLALRWQEALAEYKKENHIIAFDDMEKIFLAMLTESKYQEVQEDIRSSFRLLMVDEFQDSNPIQLKIFNRLSELIADNGGESIWVGDPKQAIYGFRGSDSRFIAQILSRFDFSDDGTPVEKQGGEMLGTDQLLQSWRSRPSLVDFSNRIFLKPFQTSGLKDKQITLEAHHTPKTDTMGDEQALYIWRTATDKTADRAQMLAAQIKRLLDSGCKVHHKECDKETSMITYRDIAVLCFSNEECNRVASILRQLGLPASCEETNLMQCLEVYLLKTLLLFVQHPSDKMLRAELAILLCDASTEEILKDRIDYVNRHYSREDKAWDRWMDDTTDHRHADAISRLQQQTRRYQSLSIHDAVVAIHEEFDLDNVVQKWGDATQRRHNLSTVVSMAKAYDDMCQQMGIGSSIIGFINYLTITKPDNKTDNAADTIKVLTYHRSKGLEWPVVILCHLWRDFVDDKEIAKKKFCGVNVREVEGQQNDIFHCHYYINLFPSGAGPSSSSMPEMMFEAITGKTDEKYNMPLFGDLHSQTYEEALRLLYVGVTRAKDILVSLTSKKDTKTGGEAPSLWPQKLGIGNGLSNAPFGTGYNETLVELASPSQEEKDNAVPQYRQTTNKPVINEAPLLSLSPSTISSFDDAFHKNVQVAESGERIIDWAMFKGEQSDAVKGSCIHNIFASYKPGDDVGNLQRVEQTLSNYGFTNTQSSQRERLIASIQWLYDFLTRAYGKATRIQQECPLLYPLPTGQILRGEIDLQWYYLDNDCKEKCVLIDYKTFPGRRDELEGHTEKYYAQLSAYHSALSAAGVAVADTLIYYPVQAHVRRLMKGE